MKKKPTEFAHSLYQILFDYDGNCLIGCSEEADISLETLCEQLSDLHQNFWQENSVVTAPTFTSFLHSGYEAAVNKAISLNSALHGLGPDARGYSFTKAGMGLAAWPQN